MQALRREKAAPPPRRAQQGTLPVPRNGRRPHPSAFRHAIGVAKAAPLRCCARGADRTAPGHRCSWRARPLVPFVSLPECTAAQCPPDGLPTALAALLEAAGRLHGPRSAL